MDGLSHRRHRGGATAPLVVLVCLAWGPASAAGTGPGIRDVAGEAGSRIALAVPGSAGREGAADITYLSGLPSGATVRDGRNERTMGDGAYVDVTGWDLDGLSVVIDAPGSYELTLFTVSGFDPAGAPTVDRAAFVLRVGPGREASPEPAFRGEPRKAAGLDAAGIPEPAPAAWTDATPAAGAVPRGTARVRDVPDAPVGVPADEPSGTSSIATAAAPDATAAMRAKAEGHILLGEIAAARLYLEGAVARGDARAASLLAQTFDPTVLRRWNVIGARSDVARARALYGLAAKGGIPQPLPGPEASR